MSDLQLTPCPFCGEDEDLVITKLEYGYAIKCQTCLACSPKADEEGQAVDFWNERAAQIVTFGKGEIAIYTAGYPDEPVFRELAFSHQAPRPIGSPPDFPPGTDTDTAGAFLRFQFLNVESLDVLIGAALQIRYSMKTETKFIPENGVVRDFVLALAYLNAAEQDYNKRRDALLKQLEAGNIKNGEFWAGLLATEKKDDDA